MRMAVMPMVMSVARRIGAARAVVVIAVCGVIMPRVTVRGVIVPGVTVGFAPSPSLAVGHVS